MDQMEVKQDKKEQERQRITLYMFSERVPLVTYATIKHASLPLMTEYFHLDINLGASARQILYKETSILTVETSVANMINQHRYRQLICTSEVSIFYHKDQVPSHEEPLLFTFMEFSLEQDRILMDFFIMSMRQYYEKVNQFYHSSRPFMILDIDKTILISDGDCPPDQQFSFQSHFYIHGLLAINGERFSHTFMLRNGLYEFLVEAQKMATIFVLTAGDIHYARCIVDTLNRSQWTHVQSALNEKQVYIPLTNVFSVRNHRRYALKKRFDRILPLVHLYPKVQYVGVDDDLRVWEEKDVSHIISITPFMPSEQDNAFIPVCTRLMEQFL